MITPKFFAVSLSFLLAESCVHAATLGLPIFSTAPGTINFVNQFHVHSQYKSIPEAQDFSLSSQCVISSVQGAPGLISKALDIFLGPALYGFGAMSLNIDRTAIGGFYIAHDAEGFHFSIQPPVENSVVDPVTGLETVEFLGILAAFGPKTFMPGFYNGVTLLGVVRAPLPRMDGTVCCQIAHTDLCEFSNLIGLSDLNGLPVAEALNWSGANGYVEGSLSGATMTFYTQDGRSVAAAPLPAGGAILLTALPAAGMTLRRKFRRAV